MTCEEREILLLLYATGTLEPAEMQEMRAHLDTPCPKCAAALIQAEAAVHQLPQSLPPVPPSSAAWDRIEKRIDVQTKLAPPRRSFAPALGWAAAAVVALVLGLMYAQSQRDLEHARAETLAVKLDLETTRTIYETKIQTLKKDADFTLASISAKVDLLQKEIDIHERTMHGAERYVLAANPGAGQDDAGASLYWHKREQVWCLLVHGMKPAEQGKTYELWAVTPDGKKMAMGTFDVDANGQAIMDTHLPKTLTDITLAAVTDEPKGGSPQPTGNFQILGQIKKQ